MLLSYAYGFGENSDVFSVSVFVIGSELFPVNLCKSELGCSKGFVLGLSRFWVSIFWVSRSSAGISELLISVLGWFRVKEFFK